MDKFATLEPVRLYASTGARLFSRGATTTNKDSTDKTIAQVLVGRLTSDLHLTVVHHLPIPDIATYSRCCRATRLCASHESVWEKRWKALGVDNDPILQNLIEHLQRKTNEKSAGALPEDDFGDFTTAELYSPSSPDVMRDFSGAFQNMQLTAPPSTPSYSQHTANESSKKKYTRVHNLLKPLIRILLSPPHLILSQLAEQVSPSLYHEAKILRLLSHFLSPDVQPLRRWESLYLSLRSAMDRFDSNLLGAFDIADEKGDEGGMKVAAASSWELWDKSSADWEMGKVWAEKKEIFYQQGKWKALDNFTKDQELDFAAMDEFMEFILLAIKEHGSTAVRVFPPASHVLLLFSERLSSEVVGEYVTTLLAHAREISEEIYLKSTAASFREAWKMVDRIMEVANQRKDSNISKTLAEDIVYKMFETHMDEYLDEEIEWVKHAFDVICKGWDQETSSASSPTPATGTTRFLASQNPALVKRNVLASFTSLLLLPVTIVPRTVGVVGEALITGGSAAVQGIAMLNPQRWGPGGMTKGGRDVNSYSTNLEKDGRMLFEADDDEEDVSKRESVLQKKVPESLTQFDLGSPTPLMTPSNSIPTPLTANGSDVQHQLDLLLSLDVALEIIHADRESLKRVETFTGYPGHYGHRVHDTIEEIFILMLQTVGERHILKGFALATERMKEYKPAEHSETSNVAPLVQFFELVHIGDTIQSMVQVYFDKELAPHIDKTDFLNVVVREKKRFENTLDDSVAAGLNAGTEVLMNQIDHVISKLTKPREYYPPEDDPLELGPTTGCIEAIRCLEIHCKLLKGSTSKEVLEVFYQEVGLRLIAILQKHIKRQIISLNGGFLVISDLNAYNAFISSLKIPSIIADFSHLKMLGHVYVVEDAKDLAQIVRDVTRYGGAYKPEDVYEFIQRRSDWKKIEKIVDKTMYSLSFKEDCIIA